MPIKRSMRGNTAAIYQHNGSNTRKGAKSCPVQKQRHMVRQIKYISAENKVHGHWKKRAFELTNGDKNQLVDSNTELDQCISVSIWS